MTLTSLFDLKNRTGLITGGSGKMSYEFCQLLSSMGAHVIVSDIKAPREGPWSFFETDLGDSHQIERLGDFVEKKSHGKLDFWIHNVMSKPSGYYEPFDQYSLETWNQVLSQNLTSAFYTAKIMHPLLKKSGHGAVVLTASTYGWVAPDPHLYDSLKAENNPYSKTAKLNCPAAYTASKGALLSFARHLATHWAPEVRVNSLVPGGVFDGQEEAFQQAYRKRTPLGRMADWSDFNGPIALLVSDASRYMTGTEVVVDGGWSSW